MAFWGMQNELVSQTLRWFFPNAKPHLLLLNIHFQAVFSLKEMTLKDFRNQHEILFMVWLRFSSEVHTDPGFTLNNIYISINAAVRLSGADSCLKSTGLVCSIREQHQSG